MTGETKGTQMNKPLNMPHISDSPALKDVLSNAGPSLSHPDDRSGKDPDTSPPRRPTQDDLDAQARERAHEEGQIAIRKLEEASRKAAIETRKQQGLRRAEAIRGGLTSMIHAGRAWDQITSDDANCIWTIASLHERMAGIGPQPNVAENPRASAAKDSERVLSAAGEKAAGEQFGAGGEA
jgi:hypothetical protein